MENGEKKENFEFVNIQEKDVNNFIKFLKGIRPDYPYRWFFDPIWIRERVVDENYIWGVVKRPGTDRIIGTVICYYDIEKNISVLKLLLVHPNFRKIGILNSIFFKRINEDRVVDRIRFHKPNLLFAEILNGHLTSQKMIIRMNMSFLGYFPNKTRINDVNADLIPCALFFNQKHSNILIDERIVDNVNVILNDKKLIKLRTIKTGIEEQKIKKLNFKFKLSKTIDKTLHEIIRVSNEDGDTLEFKYNKYLNNITEARISSDNPEIIHFLVNYLKNYNADYTEIMIPPNLMMQDIMLQNDLLFTGFLPNFWKGSDVLAFITWKNRPFLIHRAKNLFDNVMRGVVYAAK
ncbi:MAG: hypothetical protein EAX96_18980 [Candidatus Lokiarchaeota archaeon]|nr:hypothetical protein [Candidatus Lokiarchaeota archaeon]